MRRTLFIVLALSLGAVLPRTAAGQGAEPRNPGPDERTRIVTLGGSVTEIVFALGAGRYVVGADASSAYPDSARSLPHVAYHRQVSAEGVLSLKPTMVIATDEAGPPTALEQVKSSGVRLVVIQALETVDGAKVKIRRIAEALNRQAEGEALVRAIDHDLEKTSAWTLGLDRMVRVLFVYARGLGTLMVSGRKTGADAVIELAGGVNAVDGYEGYKPLTAEAALAAAPDVVMMMGSGLESVGGAEGVWKLPGLAATPAGKNRRIIAPDGLLFLGFGPRLGQAVVELHRAFYPEEKRETP